MGKIILAPMEGLADSLLRDLLTRQGGYDGAVSEFVRVTGSRLPTRAFRYACPELHNGSRTPAGTPVFVQLLGSNPDRMAESAAQLAVLGPAGIDLNFGCPAPTVNRHGGGAMLLNDPALMARIAAAVRGAVPLGIPVTAKMRLGVSDTGNTLACAAALESGGVASLVVHARTRDQGYRPPAHWEWIARVRESVSVPVVANGEVWSESDYHRCREVTGCSDVMIGRGAVADPFLARRIRGGGGAAAPNRDSEWHELVPLLDEYWQRVKQCVAARHAPGRLKMWLNSLRRCYPQAETLYRRIRSLTALADVDAALAAGIALA